MAATDLERLVVQLSADMKQYQNAMDKAVGLTDKSTKKIQKQFESMASKVNSSFASIGAKGLGLAAGAVGTDKLIEFADSYTRIQNSLKVAGLQGDELTATFGKLYDIALKNHAPIEALASLYGRAALQAKALGASNADLIKFTDSVATSLRVSGTSASEAGGALLQLGQSLGTGRVMAEEFNSVLEGMPALALAAARRIKDANGSVGELKALVSNGKVSSRALFDAIILANQDIQKQAELTSITISGAMTDLSTSLIKAVGEFDDTTGASDALAKAISAIAEQIGPLGQLFADTWQTLSSMDLGTFAENWWTISTALHGAADGFNELNKQANIAGQGLNSAIKDTYSEFKNAWFTSVEDQQKAITDRNAKEAKSAEIAAVYGAQVKENADAITKMNKAASDAGGGMGVGQFGPAIPAGRGKSQGPNNANTIKPTPVDDRQINLSDYKVPGAKDKKATKDKQDAYEKATKSVQDRINVMTAETAAQSKLNPLVDDYGFAVAKAKTQQELLNAAEKAKKAITPELTAQIEAQATAYANATVNAAKLNEEQERMKKMQQDISDTAKDVTQGIVQGFIQGKSAAEVFSGALQKVADKLLNLAFDQLFDPTSKGGMGLGGGFAKLFGFAAGGYTGYGNKDDPAGIVHKGEYVIPADKVKKMGVPNIERMIGYANGGPVGIPSMSRLAGSGVGSGGLSINYAPSYDNRGVDNERLAKLEQIQAKDRAEFSARVVNSVRKAKSSNVKGV
jgi:tape measure domain-containing protein